MPFRNNMYFIKTMGCVSRHSCIHFNLIEQELSLSDHHKVSSQATGHWVMGTWSLSGGDRPWEEALGDWEWTVSGRTLQTRWVSPKKGIPGRTDWKSKTENMTLPERAPSGTPFLSSSSSSGLLPQETWVFRGWAWKVQRCWSSLCGSAEMNPTSLHGDMGSISGLASWVKEPVLPWAVV